jgi:hypothetical protein
MRCSRRPPQNRYFKLNWICWETPAVETRPNVGLLTARFGNPKFAPLNALNVSNRNSADRLVHDP